MYMNPEIARTIAAQRTQELQARAEAFRRVAEARAARRPDRTRTARFRWPRRASARRPAVAYSSPRNA
jgi:hypothetical protein